MARVVSLQVPEDSSYEASCRSSIFGSRITGANPVLKLPVSWHMFLPILTPDLTANQRLKTQDSPRQLPNLGLSLRFRFSLTRALEDHERAFGGSRICRSGHPACPALRRSC